MKRIIISSLFTILAATALAQDQGASAIQQAVETKNFVFKAESVTPQRSRMRQLTPEYDVVLTPDSIISFLPYFGRAFTAPINPSEGGIKFTSTHFDYTFSQKKKNRWEIVIKPKDVSDVRELYLSIFNNGRASLGVNSSNRESISFNGIVREGNPINKKAF